MDPALNQARIHPISLGRNRLYACIFSKVSGAPLIKAAGLVSGHNQQVATQSLQSLGQEA